MVTSANMSERDASNDAPASSSGAMSTGLYSLDISHSGQGNMTEYFRTPRTYLSSGIKSKSDGVRVEASLESLHGVVPWCTTGEEVILKVYQHLKAKGQKLAATFDYPIYYCMIAEQKRYPVSPYELIVVKEEDCAGKEYFSITANGITHFKPGSASETIPLNTWLKYRSLFDMINYNTSRFSFVRNFKIWKGLTIWKRAARLAKMDKARRRLDATMIQANAEFVEALCHTKEVALACGTSRTTVEDDIPRPPTAKDKESSERPLLTGLEDLLALFKRKRAYEIDDLHQKMMSGIGRAISQIEEMLSHIQEMVNTVCTSYLEFQYHENVAKGMPEISNVDLSLRDIKFMFGRHRSGGMHQISVGRILSKSEDQQKKLYSFVRLVEAIITDALVDALSHTLRSFEELLCARGRPAVVHVEAKYNRVVHPTDLTVEEIRAMAVRVSPGCEYIVEKFEQVLLGVLDIGTVFKRPFVYPMYKTNELPQQFQRKNFVMLKGIVNAHINADGIVRRCLQQVEKDFSDALQSNAKLIKIPQSKLFVEALIDVEFLSSSKGSRMYQEGNSVAFSRNLVAIRDWLQTAQSAVYYKKHGAISFDIKQLNSDIVLDLNNTYNKLLDELHNCFQQHCQHMLDLIHVSSSEVKVLEDELNINAIECERAQADRYVLFERIEKQNNFYLTIQNLAVYMDKESDFNATFREKVAVSETLMNEIEGTPAFAQGVHAPNPPQPLQLSSAQDPFPHHHFHLIVSNPLSFSVSWHAVV